MIIAYILVCLFGLGFCIYGLTWKDKFMPMFILGVFGGLGLMAFGIFCLSKLLRTPKEIIRFDGEKLYFPQGSYYPWQIQHIVFREMRTRYGWRQTWGKLRVCVEGQTLEYYFVEDVKLAHYRLMQLVNQYAQNNQ